MIWEDNRINFARMFLNKGEPYTLRKYKAIFKREMTQRPDLYDVLDANGNPKNKIDGIIAKDLRFAHTIKEKLENVDFDNMELPADFEEEYKKFKAQQDATGEFKERFVDDRLLKSEDDQEADLEAADGDAKAEEGAETRELGELIEEMG